MYRMTHILPRDRPNVCVLYLDGSGRWGHMFVKINKRLDRHGETTYTAAVMRSDRVRGKVVQTTVAYLGRVEEDQIPYLKAAYAKRKPRLVWDDGEGAS